VLITELAIIFGLEGSPEVKESCPLLIDKICPFFGKLSPINNHMTPFVPVL